MSIFSDSSAPKAVNDRGDVIFSVGDKQYFVNHSELPIEMPVVDVVWRNGNWYQVTDSSIILVRPPPADADSGSPEGGAGASDGPAVPDDAPAPIDGGSDAAATDAEQSDAVASADARSEAATIDDGATMPGPSDGSPDILDAEAGADQAQFPRESSLGNASDATLVLADAAADGRSPEDPGPDSTDGGCSIARIQPRAGAGGLALALASLGLRRRRRARPHALGRTTAVTGS